MSLSTDLRGDQLAPHSIEAEEAVLGSILIHPEALFEVLPFLKAEDFFIVRHSWIWEAMVNLHERHDPIDYLTVVSELEQMGHLAETGGAAYILSLINKTPSALNVEGYGRIVERMALRRGLIDAAQRVVRVAHSDETEIEDVINDAEQAIFAVTERRLVHDLVPVKQVVSEYFDHISFLARHQEMVMGVPTGFIDIDRILGGMQKSDLLIIAARPGMGKSSMLNSIVLNAARLNQRIAVFSLEMSNEQLAQRFISAVTHIPSNKLREGRLDDRDWAEFVKATEDISRLPVHLDDTPALSTQELRSKARRLHLEYGLNLIVVDYLQLMTTPFHSENRVQEISYISRSLKQLARELNVPLLAAAQLSRAVEQRTDKRPQLSDLRESGCLAGETLISLADSGQNIPIRDLEGRAGFAIWALNPTTLKLEKTSVSRAFCTGSKPVIRLTTRLGRTIRATANHRFMTIDGWKRLDELHEGEHIALPRVIHDHENQQTMSDSELALLGHLIGDGCTLPSHAMQYTTRDKGLADTVADLALEVFGNAVNPRIVPQRNWYQVYLSSTRHHTHNVRSAVSEWLDDLGIFGLRSFQKFVPDEVFEQPTRGVALFLRHLWATDGCINLVKGKKLRPIAYYASSSCKLAQDVQALLLRFGINAALKRTSQNGKGRDQYHVIVTGKRDLSIFISDIRAVGEDKQRSLDEVENYLQHHDEDTNRDIIPCAVWRMYTVPAMAQIGMISREMQAGLGTAYCGTGLYKQNVSRQRAARIGNVVNSNALKTLAESNVYWDRIASIIPDGEDAVFDLTVPGHHNFVADNIIVHNSIEQDSDVVAFIYRDAYYNPDTPDGNRTEIHVAKHRNGPTGVVDLIFIPELTQFQNAAPVNVNLDQL